VADHVTIDSWLPCAAYDDCFVPAVATPLLRGLYKLDDESARVSITLHAREAAAGLWEVRN